MGGKAGHGHGISKRQHTVGACLGPLSVTHFFYAYLVGLRLPGALAYARLVSSALHDCALQCSRARGRRHAAATAVSSRRCFAQPAIAQRCPSVCPLHPLGRGAPASGMCHCPSARCRVNALAVKAAQGRHVMYRISISD